MTFRAPEAFIVLALLVPVALLYVVRARRRAVRDPFQFLWVGLARERPRWGRLHRWLELALVTTAIAAMIVGLARPVLPSTEAPPRARIVAIAEPSADAVDRARALVAALGVGETAAVVVASPDGARVALPPTAAPVDPGFPLAVDRDAPRDRAAVASSAARIADGFPGAEVHWLDDGVERLELPHGWRGHAVAPRPHRLAIVDVSRAADGRVSARFVNRGAAPWRGAFRATLGERTLVDEVAEVGAGGERAATVAVDPQAVGVVRLALVDVATDAVRARAALPLPGVRPARIAVVARGGAASFVGRLLGCFDPLVDTAATALVAPDATARVTPDAFDFALVLGEEPAGPLPVPAIYFGAPNPLVEVDDGGDGGPARITDAARDHPLLSIVDLGTVGARRTAACRAAPGVAVLARAGDRPMLFHRPAGGAPEALAFPFRLRDSNLLFEPALVVLVANAIARWGPAPPIAGGVGAPLPLPTDAIVEIARSGDAAPVWSGRDGDGHPFRARRDGRFAVSVADRSVDRWVAPASDDRPPATWSRPPDLPTPTPRDVWHERAAWLAWIALALLLVEWFLFHRGIL